MKRDIEKRVGALEAENDNRQGVYVFKWSSWTDEQAIEQHVAEGLPLPPDTPIIFIIWRDDHLPEPVPFR